MLLRFLRSAASRDVVADETPSEPRRLDLDALLIPFQRPVPAAESLDAVASASITPTRS